MLDGAAAERWSKPNGGSRLGEVETGDRGGYGWDRPRLGLATGWVDRIAFCGWEILEDGVRFASGFFRMFFASGFSFRKFYVCFFYSETQPRLFFKGNSTETLLNTDTVRKVLRSRGSNSQTWQPKSKITGNVIWLPFLRGRFPANALLAVGLEHTNLKAQIEDTPSPGSVYLCHLLPIPHPYPHPTRPGGRRREMRSEVGVRSKAPLARREKRYTPSPLSPIEVLDERTSLGSGELVDERAGGSTLLAAATSLTPCFLFPGSAGRCRHAARARSLRR